MQPVPESDSDDKAILSILAGESNYALFSCDCNALPEQAHLSTCDLWGCWEFANGWAVWDHGEKRLRDIAEVTGDVYAEPTSMPETIQAKAKAKITKGGGKAKTSKSNNKPLPLAGGWTGTYQKCRHYQQPVTMPDGTIFYASSSTYDRKGAPIPDLGLYLDGCWKPDTIAYHVGCPDRNVPIPTVPQVLWMANHALTLAREGKRVEVGCIGGHGRTGLMLAVLATIIQPDIADAVKYVRENYCPHAIESDLQEWYVAGVKCELAGDEWPEKPKPVVYKGKSSSEWDKITYKYAELSDMPEDWTSAQKNAAWSEHADTCTCHSCDYKNAPLCSECGDKLFSPAAVSIGKHTWNCSKSKATGTTCPSCKRASYVISMDCLDAWHCNAIDKDKCRCFRHHPGTFTGCECERCQK